MWLDLILLAVGGFGVWLGAEGMVRGAVKLAKRFGVSPLVIGLTIVSFGTSAPELVVSVFAAVGGHNEMALGNVIGSNIINIALVLGLSALISTVHVDRGIFRRDLPLMMIVTAAVIPMAYFGDRIGRVDGIILLASFAGYLLYSLHGARKEYRRATLTPDWDRPELRKLDVVFLVGGTLVLATGAESMVRGASGLAAALGVSARIVGVTIVAFGTSVPELAASAVAAKHGEGDLAVGNVVGSNIFNLLLILGSASVISPIPTDLGWGSTDFIFLIGISFVLLPLMRIGWKLGRVEGAILLTLYATSVAALFV